MFEGDFANMCAESFPLMLMEGQANRQACAECEQGPQSAWADIFSTFKSSGVMRFNVNLAKAFEFEFYIS